MGSVTDALPGRAAPLGATPGAGGTNFAVASSVAEGAEICLFDDAGHETRVRLPEYDDGVWHGLVPDVGPGQAYGFRVHGPYHAAQGLRCNPAKLLLDPYARATCGEVRFGPEVFDYDWDDHDAPSTLDSAGHVPLSLVTDSSFDWGDDAPLRRDYADTIFYEVHARGFTMRHPDVPGPLRGTYAGLAHESVLSYLTDLGVTAVELLPVHQYVPDQFLLERGLTNYWGYNTIGYFAPHAGYSAAVRGGGPSTDPDILALRAQRSRAMLATLLLSFGVPLILGGDEIGRTQRGNNNAYCQDNEISWVDWSATDDGLRSFTRDLMAFRRSHPVFRRHRFLTGIEAAELGWFTPAGNPMTDENWNDGNALALGVYLDGSDAPNTAADGSPLYDDDFLVLVNGWWEQLDFTIGDCRPGLPRPGLTWAAVIDTFDPPQAGQPDGARYHARDRVTVGPRSVQVLRAPRSDWAPGPGDHVADDSAG